MDQPANEIMKLEAMMEAWSKYQQREEARDSARKRNKQRHSPRPQEHQTNLTQL